MSSAKKNILYLDDEDGNLAVFQATFRHKYNVMIADTIQKAKHILQNAPIDLIISDYKMPEKNGVDFLKDTLVDYPILSRILMTAYSEPEILIDSINKAHIYCFVTKPWKKAELDITIENALRHSELKRQNHDLLTHLQNANSELTKANEEIVRLKDAVDRENDFLKREIAGEHSNFTMIGHGATFQALEKSISRVASVDTTVLIQGETGTGKELVARAIHAHSSRSDKPFIKLNCASLPTPLVESELFGYEKGAFTGAQTSKPGLFQIAHTGTVFLDEIGELPLEVQPKLLRVLQEGEFFKVGSSKTVRVDVRIISATNRTLSEAVTKGTFRSDLFYRLNSFPIKTPALRHRLEDIPALVNFFVEKYQKKLRTSVAKIDQSFIKRLMNHDWPGNIRELESVVERSILMCTAGILNGEVLKFSMDDSEDVPDVPPDALTSLEEIERAHILRVLEATKGKISGAGGAAAVLNINHNTLRSRMVKLGIDFKKAGVN